MDKTPFTDSLGADRSVLDRLVQRRQRETGDGRYLGRRLGIVWRCNTHLSLPLP